MPITSTIQVKQTTSIKHINLTRKELDNPVFTKEIKFVVKKQTSSTMKILGPGGFIGEFY